VLATEDWHLFVDSSLRKGSLLAPLGVLVVVGVLREPGPFCEPELEGCALRVV
jgi:hypothetical protein